jgi:thioredoxin-related protein
MKKYLSISLFLVFFLSMSCKKKENTNESVQNSEKNEEVKEDEELIFNIPILNFTSKPKPIVFEYTSTGCPGCGSWGKPTFNNVVNQYQDEIVPVAVHIKYGDPMITETSNDVGANRHGQFYTPQIWVNDSNGVVINNNMIMGQASVDRINHLIGYYKAKTPDLFLDIQTEAKSSKLGVRYGIKSNLISGDDLYLSCYLMESKIEAQQSSYANNPAIHNHVIRKSDEMTFGRLLSLNSGNDNTQEFETTFDLQNETAEYSVTIILWKKDGNRYVPLGAFNKKF